MKPFIRLAEINKNDVVDLLYRGIAGLARSLHGVLSITQTGKLRWYAANMGAGLLVVLALALYI